MTVLDRIPLERITAEARRIHFWRTVLTILAGVLYGLGWLAGKAVIVGWFALAWTAAAIKVGWQEARKEPSGTR